MRSQIQIKIKSKSSQIEIKIRSKSKSNKILGNPNRRIGNPRKSRKSINPRTYKSINPRPSLRSAPLAQDSLAPVRKPQRHSPGRLPRLCAVASLPPWPLGTTKEVLVSRISVRISIGFLGFLGISYYCTRISQDCIRISTRISQDLILI